MKFNLSYKLLFIYNMNTNLRKVKVQNYIYIKIKAFRFVQKEVLTEYIKMLIIKTIKKKEERLKNN